MGWNIGMPCLKLNNAGNKSKHCGDFGKVAAEALEERQGLDKDLDPERSKYNVYFGFKTAKELMEYSEKHIAELSKKQKENGGRGVRSDAVVMISTIVKPPASFMNSLSMKDQRRFLDDAAEELTDLIGKARSKSTAYHFDELGSHLHFFWEPMTEDGRLCAKEECNLKFYAKLNKEMPQRLRARGWDIDDCLAYDQAKELLQAEEEKAQQRRESGQESVKYKAQAEQRKNELLEEIDHLQEVREDLEPVARAVTDQREIEEILDKSKRTITGRVSRKLKDDQILVKAAKHGAQADAKIYDLNEQLKESQGRLERLQERENALQERSREQERVMEENRLLRRFLGELGLLERFEQWMRWIQERKQERKLQRDQDPLQRN